MKEKSGEHMSTCGGLINSADKDGTFLNRIITGNETWCFLYDPQLKQYRPPENRNHRQERTNSDRAGQKARKCLKCFLTHLELFTWNSSQKKQL
jgi:hypothetical protein